MGRQFCDGKGSHVMWNQRLWFISGATGHANDSVSWVWNGELGTFLFFLEYSTVQLLWISCPKVSGNHDVSFQPLVREDLRKKVIEADCPLVLYG